MFVLRTYIDRCEYILQKNGPNYEWLKAKSVCQTLVDSTSANFALELVYGCAGTYVI